jgi:hypothetical protein
MRRLPRGLVAAAVVLIPSLLFLGRYAIDGTGNAPVGSDTPQHVWRSAVVARLGLEALPAVDGEAHALHTNADRPGLPLVMAALGSVTGAEPRDLVYVLPAVLAAAIAMAAAALAGSIPGVPWWGAALAGIATGASVHVAFTANGYLDQLLVEPLALAAGAGALTAAAGGRGRVLSAACLAAAFLVHWQFAAVFAGLLLLLALACVPESLRRVPGRNRPGSFVDTPTGRVGTILAAGTGLGVAGLLAGASGMPRLPTEFARGTTANRGQARSYRLPATVVAAVAGLVSLLVPGGGSDRRRAGWLLGAWALLPAGAALLYTAGRTVPVQRTLSFALAIPLLGALGVVAAVGWLRVRGGKAAAAVAAMLAVAALLASMSFGWDVWRSRRPWSEGRRLAELHAAAAYLAGAGGPTVIVVDKRGTSGSSGEFGTIPALRRIRAELPPTQALHTTVYLGDPDLLLEGRPSLRPDAPGFDSISRDTWRAVRPLLRQDPVVVILRSHFDGFGEAVALHPGWSSNGWMAVVHGPPAPAQLPRAPARPSPGALLAWWASSLAVLSLVGGGWAGRFGSGSLSLRMCLAPAVGVAALVVAGLVVERLGIRMGGPGGVIVVLVVTLVGAAAAATRPPRAEPSMLRYRPDHAASTPGVDASRPKGRADP